MPRLFRPIDPASLALFRIVFGLLGAFDVLNNWAYYHLWVDAYNPERFQFRYMGFEWLPTFHDPWMSILLWSLIVAALLVALGWHYRLAAWYFAFGFAYLFLLEKATYLNHGYLFVWLSFLMPFLPADRAFSLRAWLEPGRRLATIPFWPIGLLRFLMGVVYFYGGLAKINPDWLRAVPLDLWMHAKRTLPVIGPVVGQDWVPWVMAYGGLFLDLGAPFLLSFRKTRPWIFGFVLAFHGINTLVFSIGIFPALSIMLSALFFPPDFPRRIARWLGRPWKSVERMRAKWRERLEGVPPSKGSWHSSPRWQPAIIAGLLLLALIHLTVPFRHRLFPGQVAWTEEGHRYSWRMMLRAKAGSGTFIVKDPTSGLEQRIELKDHLWSSQYRKMLTHPDMIWQFAQHLRELYAAAYPGVEVYADIRVRLNDYPRQQYIDPDCDLAKTEWHFWKTSDWILEPEFERGFWK